MATRFSVAIIGGGIGGLFAANALLQRGLRVTVHEQAPAIGEIGAGFYVTPNAVRHLERAGLGAAVTSAHSPGLCLQSPGPSSFLREVYPGGSAGRGNRITPTPRASLGQLPDSVAFITLSGWKTLVA